MIAIINGEQYNITIVNVKKGGQVNTILELDDGNKINVTFNIKEVYKSTDKVDKDNKPVYYYEFKHESKVE
jgi:hypothetical protein